MTTERISGPTPNGGEYALVTFTDDTLAEVDKDKATQMVMTEYDADGSVLRETVATYGQQG